MSQLPADPITPVINQVRSLPPSTVSAQTPPVTSYAALTQYVWNYGLAQSAVAGPTGTPCEIVRLTAPVCQRIVTWIATCFGQAPVMPSTAVQSDNEILLSKQVSLCWPGRTIDGTPVICRSGQYVYALLVPPSDQDALATGSIWIDTEFPALHFALPSEFSDYLGGIVPPVSGTLPMFNPKTL